MGRIRLILICCCAVLAISCTKNTAEYGATGAAVGATGAVMIGMLTDVIVDGKVDPYRMTRNAVSGGIAGGVSGTVAGAHKDKQEEKQQQLQQTTTDVEKLKTKIGEENFIGAQYLIMCKHEDAFRIGLKTAGSDNADYSKAGYLLQALVDKDRGNTTGMNAAIDAFVSSTSKDDSAASIREQLDTLSIRLQEERRIKGLNPSCS